MAKEKISDRATRAYGAARENRYVQRLIEDEDLRASILAAISSARKAYDRFSEDPSLERATQDRRVQKELSRAADSLRDASERLTEPPRRRHTARNILLLGILTGGLVLAFSESARKALLDAVFGEEEEFVYTSTTTAPTTPSPAQSNGTPVSEVQATDSDE